MFELEKLMYLLYDSTSDFANIKAELKLEIEDVLMMVDFLKVGKIVNTHALKGEVRVVSHSDFKDERFAKGAQLFIAFNGEHVEVEIENHRMNKNLDLLKFKGIDSINDVEKYKGCELLVDGSELGELDENEFYYHEIIGCTVSTVEDEVLGMIADVIQTGANDVWIVKQQGVKDLLIPYIDDVVKEVDIQAKTVKVELLEGMRP